MTQENQKNESSIIHVEASTDGSSPRARLSARQLQYEKSMTIAQCLRTYWRCSLWSLYGQLCAVGYGIDGIIAGSLLAMPQFRQDYGDPFIYQGYAVYIIPAWWQSLYAGLSNLCQIIGAMLCGYLADKIGRRWTNLIFCAISVVGVIVQYFSNGSLGVLTAGKCINAIPIGAWLMIGPMYASEVAPVKLRPFLASLTNVSYLFGLVLFTGVCYVLGPRSSPDSYKISIALQLIIPCMVLLTGYFWPESPVWLSRMGKHEQAKAMLLRIHGKNSGIDTEAIYANIQETLEQEEAQRRLQNSASWAECFNGTNRRRTLTCMFLYASLYLSGITFVIGFQSYYYQLIGYSPSTSFQIAMICNALQFVANMASWPLTWYMGRRPLLVWGQLACAASLFAVGFASIPLNHAGNLATIPFMILWAIFFQTTLGPGVWAIGVELPSYRLKAKTQAISNVVLSVVQWVVTFVMPYMINPDSGDLKGRIGFIFGGLTLIAFFGIFFFVPETKNRSAAELDELFETGVSARKFATTRTAVEDSIGRNISAEKD